MLSYADAVEIDGIFYNLVSEGRIAEVTSNPSEYSGAIDIPATVTYNDITYSVTSIGNYAFLGCTSMTSVTIPESVDSIGSYAFRSCSGLTSVTIPNSVTSIGKHAFYECSGLTSLHITDLAAWCGIVFDDYEANPLYYAHHMFVNGEEITDLIIPDGVTCINDYAFSFCSSLTSVTIPNSVTSIGSYAFRNCSGLTSVTISNSVTRIGYYAFCYCSGLTSITIPNSVTFIGNSAFYRCSGLASVIIPGSVTSIGYAAFWNCSGLTDVYCLAEDVPATVGNAFSNSPIESATLYVPASSVEAYRSADVWSDFGTIVGLTEDKIDAVEDVRTAVEDTEVARYNIQGRMIGKPQSGINIVRYSDGTTRKVLVK